MVGEINCVCVIPCAHGGTLLIKYGWLVNIFGLTTRTQKLGSGPRHQDSLHPYIHFV